MKENAKFVPLGLASWRVLVPAAIVTLAFSGAGRVYGASHPRLVIVAAEGVSITWDGNNGGFGSPDVGAGPGDNAALASRGAVAFASSDLGDVLSLPFHRAINLNDGLYGNAASWISANGVGGTSDADPFAGVRFSGLVAVSSLAWGRDNGDNTEGGGAPFVDRTVGTYTLQFTKVGEPGGDTLETGDAATGWANLGTVQYLPGANDAGFVSYMRHRFDVAWNGGPIGATGVRIKVSDGWTAIDEVEVNPPADLVPPVDQFVGIVAEPGFSVQWDRNEGNYGTESDPALVPTNAASRGAGTQAFTSSDLGRSLSLPFHRAVNLNDGFYGNANSWIPDFVAGDAAPFAGLNFGHRVAVRNIAWGRDNGNVAGDCCGGTLKDRGLGNYILQITVAPNPGVATPESSWVTVASIHFKTDNPLYFNSHLRHRFEVSRGGMALSATGIRLKVPNSNTAIDELEVNSNVANEQDLVQVTAAPGMAVRWDERDGAFNDPAEGAGPPRNVALASEGTAAFSSSDLGDILGIPFHRAVNLNDGFYGNAYSWISANGLGGSSDPGPFAGLRFAGLVGITSLAWSRDNGNVAGDCCNGTLRDRALGTYRIQYTTLALPDASTLETGVAATGWQDVGSVYYRQALGDYFTPYLRHRFEISAGGQPLQATGIRLLVSDGNLALDELEINAPTAEAPRPLELLGAVWSGDGQSLGLRWRSEAGAFYAVERSANLEAASWVAIMEGVPAQGEETTVSAAAGGARAFYRIRQE